MQSHKLHFVKKNNNHEIQELKNNAVLSSLCKDAHRVLR